MEDTMELVRSQSLFAGLGVRHLEFLASVARIVEFRPQSVLFRQDDEAQDFYVLLEGEATLELPREVPFSIQTLRPGELVGLSWLYPPYRWTLTARADHYCRALAFDAAAVRKECEVDHELGYRLYSRLIAVVGRRLQATRIALSELGLP